MILLLSFIGQAVVGGSSTEAQGEGYPLIASSGICESNGTNCTPVGGVGVYFESADGSFSDHCVTSIVTGPGGYPWGACSVVGPFGSTIYASIDTATIPPGYYLEGAPTQELLVPDAIPDGVEVFGPSYVFLPSAPEAPAPTEVPPPAAPAEAPAATDVPTVAPVEEGGMGAAFYSATCDAVGITEPVAQLNASRAPEGMPIGMEGAVPVATGFTVVPLSLDEILEGEHVLAVFDENDPTKMVACGPAGGVLDSNGALAIGLLPVAQSNVVGVAYLGEQEDGSTTGVSLFVIEQES